MDKQEALRRQIQFHARVREHHAGEINRIAKMHIADFHFLDLQVSEFWTCDKSPIGMCVFTVDEYGRKLECRYCGGPTERK